jgi:hypothetical protein
MEESKLWFLVTFLQLFFEKILSQEKSYGILTDKGEAWSGVLRAQGLLCWGFMNHKIFTVSTGQCTVMPQRT